MKTQELFFKAYNAHIFHDPTLFPSHSYQHPPPRPLYGCTAHVSLFVYTCMYIKCSIHALVHAVCMSVWRSVNCLYCLYMLLCTWRSLCCKYTTIYKFGHVPYYFGFPHFQVWASYPAITQLTNFKLYEVFHTTCSYNLPATCWCFSFTLCT